MRRWLERVLGSGRQKPSPADIDPPDEAPGILKVGAPVDDVSDKTAADQEWQLLLVVARTHNLALEIPWLKRMYLRAFQQFLDVLGKMEAKYEASMFTSVLGDPTFWALTEQRLMAVDGNSQAKKMLREVLGTFRSGLEEGRGPLPDLKDDPVVIASYGVMMPTFANLTLETVTEKLQEADRLDVAGIERLGTIVDLAVEAEEADCLGMAQLLVAIARREASGLVLAHALTTLGSVLASPKISDKPSAIDAYQEAYRLFSGPGGDPKHARVVAYNVQRLSASLGKGPSGTLEFTETERMAVQSYNEACDAGNLEEAVQVLDRVEAEASASARLEFNALIGNLLLRLNRVPDAYKRLNRCRNIRDEFNLHAHRSATPELLEAYLFLHEHQARQAATLLQKTRDRLRTDVSSDMLVTLYIALTAALVDFDWDGAIREADEALTFAQGRDRVFLLSNRAGAHIRNGDLAAADEDVKAAFMHLGDRLPDDPIVFDLHFRRATILARSEDHPGRLEGLQAEIDCALEFGKNVPGSKLRNLFTILADALPQDDVDRARAILERGLESAEAHFQTIARVTDDINDRGRLLSGYLAKTNTFSPFLRLFEIYWQCGDDREAFRRVQSVKSSFLIEAFISTSENLISEKMAGKLADTLKSDDAQDELRSLELFSKLSSVNPAAWRQTVDKVLRDRGALGNMPMIRPVSLESTDLGSFGMVLLAQSDRNEEIAHLSDPDFVARFLAADSALVEFIVVGDTAMALVLMPDGSVQRLGAYAFREQQVAEDRTVETVDSITEICEALSGFAADLVTRLPATCQSIVVCPMDWVWRAPFAALSLADGVLGDRFDLVVAPSASFHALCRARDRASNDTGIALVDPLDELHFADAFTHICAQRGPIAFDPVMRWEVSSDELKDAARDKGWFMIAAHGNRDETTLGLGSGIRIHSGMEANAMSSGSVLFEPLPGLACRTALILSCHAAEQPVGAAEPLGIASALLIGGARNVVAPLWEVDEVATVVFFSALLDALAQENAPNISGAVAQARRYVRDITVSELRAKGAAIFPERCATKLGEWQAIKLASLGDADRPFCNPRDWGAFCALGAA